MSDSLSTRERILELAQAYLLEAGPAGFEAKALAARGWFNQSQVNYHFGSKAALMAEAADALFDAHIERIITAVESHSDPRQGLTAWCDLVIAFNTHNGATAALVAYPDLFIGGSPRSRVAGISSSVLDATERVGTVLLSVLFAIARGKEYRRLNRARVVMVAVAAPRVTNAVVMIGMAAAGLAQVWEQHKQEPIFGFDPRRAFLKGVDQIVGDLTRTPLPAIAEDEIFEHFGTHPNGK